MSISITIYVEAQEVADEMKREPDFISEVLSYLAVEPNRLLERVRKRGLECEAEESIPKFLRDLAEAYETADIEGPS